jgi:HK97 family phage major capsid protein
MTREATNQQQPLADRLARLSAEQTQLRRTDNSVRDRRRIAEIAAEISDIQRGVVGRTRSAPPPRRSQPAPRPAPRPAPAVGPARSTPSTRSDRLDALVRSGMAEDTSELSYGLLRDLALREVEHRSTLTPSSADRLDQLVRTRVGDLDGKSVARHILCTGSDAYRSAWAKWLQHSSPAWNPAEPRAVRDFYDHQKALNRHALTVEANARDAKAARGEPVVARAMTEGGTGGLGVPYDLDPSLVITAGGVAAAQILSVCRQVISTSDTWHYFSAPSTGFQTQAELATAADETPVFGGGTDIPIWMARDYLPFSMEWGQDQSDVAANAQAMFSNAYAEFVSSKTATGSGSSDVTGLFTRMANTTTSPAHSTVTTAGSLSATDVRAVWGALPERYRVDPSCAFMASPSVETQLSALAAPSATNGLAPGDWQMHMGTGQHMLFGKPVLSVSDAPAWTGTTGAANILVVGAFQRYAAVSRLGGFSVELIPHLRDVSTGLPTGERAYFATARVGGDVIDVNAFRILSNS